MVASYLLENNEKFVKELVSNKFDEQMAREIMYEVAGLKATCAFNSHYEKIKTLSDDLLQCLEVIIKEVDKQIYGRILF